VLLVRSHSWEEAMTCEKIANFQPSLPQIKELLTRFNPRLLIMTNPHNPSGRKLDQLKEILQLVEEHNSQLSDPHKQTYLLVDEVSRELPNFRDAQPVEIPCAASLSKYAISTTSSTKCFGLSGIRMGIIIANPDILRKILLYITTSFCSNPGILEEFWLQFMQQRPAVHKLIMQEREDRFSFVESQFTQNNITFIRPDSGTNILVRVPTKPNEEYGDDVAFAEQLKEKEGVLVVFGSRFGIKGYLRVSFAHMDLSTLREGIHRFCSFYQKFGRGV